MSVPRLKPLSVRADGDRLVVARDDHEVELSDPDGDVRRLLVLLDEGSRTPAELAGELGVPEPELIGALEQLDTLGWLTDVEPARRFDPDRLDRHYSNLAFLDAFGSLHRHAADMQERLSAAHVTVLGVGGLGSTVMQHLAGLGVGRLTLLDFDVVERRNLARQFAYTTAQIGQPKVQRAADWLRAFDPEVRVTVVDARIEGPDAVVEVAADADLVIAGVDTPDQIDLWVNSACVGLGVPFIRGGLWGLQGFYWSVDPGRSACRECLRAHHERVAAARPDARWPELLARRLVHQANGPIAGMVGALVGMEALRYLTGFVPPVSAGNWQLVDFAGSCGISVEPWPADPDCAVCATAPPR